MIELDSKTRQKYIWNFLGEIVKNNLVVSKDALHKAFGSSDDDLNTIADLCTQNKLPDLTGFITDTGKTVPSVKDINNTIAGLPIYNLNNSDEADYNLCITSYYFQFYNAELSAFRSVIQFWEDMDLTAIPHAALQGLIAMCKDVGSKGLRENSKNSELIAPFQALESFTSKHSYLIIHQKSYLGVIKDTQDQVAYYADRQAEIDREKERGLTLAKDAQGEIKASVDKNDEKAQFLIEAAKSRYSVNLVEGFALQFKKDADTYGRNGIRWLALLILSFIATLWLGFNFIGGVELSPLGTSSFPMITHAVGLGAITFILYGLKILLNRIESKIQIKDKQELEDEAQKISSAKSIPIEEARTKAKVQNYEKTRIMTTNETQSLRQTLELMAWLFFGVFIISLGGSYFSLEISSPEIMTDNFTIGKDKLVNWAILLSAAAPRIIILILAGSVTHFCMKHYRTQKHLEAVNRYRATALASFRIFSDTLDSSDDAEGEVAKNAKERRDTLFNELASLIYSPIESGYQQDDKLKLTELTNLISSVANKAGSS